jgi:hypothetical protein
VEKLFKFEHSVDDFVCDEGNFKGIVGFGHHCFGYNLFIRMSYCNLICLNSSL